MTTEQDAAAEMARAHDAALGPILAQLRALPAHLVVHQTFMDVLACLSGVARAKMKSSTSPLIVEALDLANAEIEDIRDSVS